MSNHIACRILILIVLLSLPIGAQAKPAYRFDRFWPEGGFTSDPLDFENITSMMLDSSGQLYVSEDAKHPIKVFDLEGNLTRLLNDHFVYPRVEAIDDEDNVWVSDRESSLPSDQYTLRVFDKNGLFIREEDAGMASLFRSGDALFGPDGAIYVLRPMDFMVDVYSSSGELLRSFEVPISPEVLEQVSDNYDEWSTDGSCNGRPESLTVTDAGEIIVRNANRIMVFSQDGDLLHNWLPSDATYAVGCGIGGGTYVNMRMREHTLSAAGDGMFYMLSSSVMRLFTLEGVLVQQYQIRQDFEEVYTPVQVLRIDPAGNFLCASSRHIITLSTNGDMLAYWDNETNGVIEMVAPMYPFFTDDGELFIFDSRTHYMNVFTPDGTLLRQWYTAEAYGGHPLIGVDVNAKGETYLGYAYTGIIIVYAPTGELLRTPRLTIQNPSPPTSPNVSPGRVTCDNAGNLYMTNWPRGHRVMRFTEQGEYVTRWGSDYPIVHHETPLVGELDDIIDIAMAPDGAVIVSSTFTDNQDVERNRIQFFSPQGELLRGMFSSLDIVHPAFDPASFGPATGILFDPDGNMLLSDSLNECYSVFRYGVFQSTFGHHLSLHEPADRGGLAFSPSGELYMADGSSKSIRIFAPTETARLHGTITGPDGAPLRAFVVANGVRAFSTAEDGAFTLEDIPLGENNSTELEVFCDGAMPYCETFTHAGDDMRKDVTLAAVPEAAEQLQVEHRIYQGYPFGNTFRGKVYDADGQPACALVLANGRTAYTREADGDLTVNLAPADENGMITLQVFKHGAAPYKTVIEAPEP